MKRLCLCLGFAMFLLCACGGKDDEADKPKPIVITPGIALGEPAAPTNEAIEPAVAYDGTRVHMVYCQFDGTNHHVVYTQRLGGGPFSAPAPLYPTSTNDSRRPCVALDSADTLHVVWVEGTAPNREIFYATRTSLGVISNASNLTTTVSQDETNPRIHVDVAGRVHVVWEGATLPPNPTSAVFYRRTVGSVFASAQVLPFSTGGISGEMPDVGVDADQHVYIVWSESVGPNRNIRMMRSDDNGAVFNNVGDGIPIAGATDKTEPRITCGTLGQVFMAFVAQDTGGDRGLFATYTLTGGTFVAPGQLFASTTGGVRSPAISSFPQADNERTVVIAFNDGPAGGGNTLAFASRDGGKTWGDPVDLSVGNAQPATNRTPAIALDDNELVAAWAAQPTGGGVVRAFASTNTYTLP